MSLFHKLRKHGRQSSMILVTLFVLYGLFQFSPEETENTARNDAGTLESEVTVHYLDMGQGDATLVESEGHFMLIDTGNYEDVNRLTEYLKEQGVRQLDYVVGTHPHADHIGSLATIIRNYGIETLLMPDQSVDRKMYKVAMEAAKKRGVEITRPVVGKTYVLGNTSFEILAPNSSDYQEINDYSIALRLTCGETRFLWTGDAQETSESEMLDNERNHNLQAEVYHAGHHGSYNASSQEFLDAVEPEFAVISCGEDNMYGYPHEETLERLESMGTDIYRTDQQGTIVVECDGNDMNWTCSE